LIQSANSPGKIGLLAHRTRDLQRLIGDLEGEDFFLLSLQPCHGIDPFRFADASRYQDRLFHIVIPDRRDVLS